tara:strand:+ start:682 stop:1104 length:423 start_codon:yes stop_codon:yes gene_type:complete
MSGTLNKIMLIGHLGDEVKMHHFEGGGCIGRFPLATNESYTNKSTGEKISSTEWHNIVVRNKAAELCQKYLSKGDKVYIEGKIKSRKWTDDSGKERYMTEINTDVFTFLNNKSEDKQLNSSENDSNEVHDSDINNQDLPF